MSVTHPDAAASEVTAVISSAAPRKPDYAVLEAAARYRFDFAQRYSQRSPHYLPRHASSVSAFYATPDEDVR